VDGSIDQIIFERAQEYQKSLDIEKGQLLQAVLIQTPETELANKLLVIIHHLAVDGVSWRILLEDLELLVSQLSARQKVDLGGKGTSYRQWYNKLRQYGQSEQLLSQKGYWQQVSSSFQPIRTDKNYNGLVRVKDIKNYQVRLAAEQTQILLQHVPRVYHTEINDMLLASLAQTLCAFSSTDKVVIGLEGHGREDIGEGVDVSRTVGWFTNLYPVLLEVGSAGNNDELIKTIKEQLRQVPDRGLGYGVLRYFNKEDTLQNIESWDVVFNYLGQLDNVARGSQWIKVADEGAGASRSEDLVIDEKITVDGSVQSGELILNWNYSSKHFNEETIKAVASDYVANLIALIAHCVEQEKLVGSISTPSDYGLGSEIRFRELDKFLNETQEGKKRREQIEGLYLLNGLQQGLLFHSLYSKEVEAYIEQFACDLINPNIGFVIKSWQFVLRNHTILRSAFYSDAFDVPVQCVFKEVELPVEILDLRRLADEEQVVAINNYKAADRKKGFDFKNPPLLRLAFVQLSDNRYNMICTLHHIVVDGWSLPIIVEELLRTYEELANHREVIINNEDKFEDYIRYLESRDISEEEAYWRNYIHEIDRSTMLPFISPTADRNSGIGEFKIEYLKIDAATTLKVQSFAKHYRLTTNTLMQGVWFHLLHHYSGNDKVTFGITVSGRPNDLPNIEKRVGMFINTIPLKSVRKEGQNLVKWLQSLQQDQVLSRQYQYAPLHNIQSWSSVQGDLFDTLFVFENYPLSKAALSNNWQLKLENVHANGQTNYPLSIQISGTDEIRIGFGYNSDLLDTVYVKEIMHHFQHVLLQFTEINEETKLDDIRILTPTEEQRLLIEFNSTAVEYPDNKTVVELFEQQVLQTPGNTALIFNDTRITYSELNAKANKLARYLRNKGVKEETLVPLCIDRGVEMVVGILGILKAGGAYVPIDTEYPLDRISYMLQDSTADFAITNSSG
jgi:non-ribosomal peptide synthase protein (TIGR01720 family)